TVGECECDVGWRRLRQDAELDCNDNNADVRPTPEPAEGGPEPVPAAFSSLPYCEDGALAVAEEAKCDGEANAGTACYEVYCDDNNADVRPTPKPAEGGPEPVPAAFSSLPYCEDGALAIAEESKCDGEASPDATCYEFYCEDKSEPSFDFDCDGKVAFEHEEL